jgi:two-component system chemotaxis sensor kinase CheA
MARETFRSREAARSREKSDRLSDTLTTLEVDMALDLTQFYQAFFDEAAEHLAAMEQLLLALDLAAPTDDDLNAIFRAAHSIKGSSGTFGFTDMTGVTHELETLLDRLRKHELVVTSEMTDAFLEARDVIKAQLDAHRRGETAPADAARPVIARLQALAQGAAVTGNGLPATDAAADPGYGFFDGREPAAPGADPGYGFFDAPGAPGQDNPSGYGFFEGAPGQPAGAPSTAGPSTASARRATDVAGKESAPSGRRATDKTTLAAQNEASTIRVGVDKVDKLINLVGELVITQAMLAQNGAVLDPIASEKLLNGLGQLERNTRDLQEAVMSIRMMPMSFVFSRFPRVVRDIATKLGKQVELKTEGEATELDKGLIEKLADPLTHLVRNSVDHGIEPADVRVAAGKPRHGTLTLRAFQQGGNIYVQVADDGAGLNRERILAKARERGMNVSDTMTDDEVYHLIFEAGLSTAQSITDVSGRGVGMDVVRRNIRDMGGSVEIDSAQGVGTRISIRLPLTLAILDGLSIAVGEETFIIPLTYISESLQPAATDVRSISGRGWTVHVRGDYLPVIALHEIFNIEPHVREIDKGIMVILECDGVRSALFVDALLGEHQVVIKSLETNYKRVPGVSGATIMGDGRVALILDAAGLAGLGKSELRNAA